MLLRQLQSALFVLFMSAPSLPVLHAQQVRHVQLQTADGIVEGVVSADEKVRTFKGIPYAAPPVGPLRWKAPQPVVPWTGVRETIEYPPRCMQGPAAGDMEYGDRGPSEDCLYVALWMPAHPVVAKLPTLVFINGEDFSEGSTSEPQQDGGNLSKKQVMVVTLNYRLGVFGYFAHPELTAESSHHASGNYGFLDQVSALQWVRKNIATFGGDPENVTIIGASSGSYSVSALMASPLAQGLFKRAIGEGGACFSTPLQSRSDAEKAGERFAQSAFATASAKELRAKSAQELLDAAQKLPPGSFLPDVDGYFLNADCRSIYARGKQTHVPLMAGWNRDADSSSSFFAGSAPTVASYDSAVRARYGSHAQAVLKLYPAATDFQAAQAAEQLTGDQRIALPTWLWLDAQQETGGSPVFRYEFDQTLPLPADAARGTEPTAPPNAEVQFVFNVLSSKKLPWSHEDRQLSDLMATYWTNFARTGDPNSAGLPSWPAYSHGDQYQVMRLRTGAAPAPDEHRDRYKLLNDLSPRH